MKDPKSTGLARLRRRILEPDGATIDELYGLEPVFEPGSAPGLGLQPTEFVAVLCPWCGERLETRVDLTSADTSYIEDCEVCCRPIEFSIEREADGALLSVGVRRLD
jgi:Cysteine-rich CPXCG